MIRCPEDVTARQTAKKTEERHELPFIVGRRIAFTELLLRDEQGWRTISDAATLSVVANRAQRELISGDFEAFVTWAYVNLGPNLARTAGLPLRRLRLELAS